MIRFTRRKALAAAAGVSALTLGGAGTATADHEENYAEIEFHDQATAGSVVYIARLLLNADGFITIHHMDLINDQDGPNTILGVSEPLGPGEYHTVPVQLFNPTTGFSEPYEGLSRIYSTQDLVAVPHRDMNHNGEFDFTVEPHTDVPFTNGPSERDDLPVDNAVNSLARVTVPNVP
jgi:hypothetical protein